MSKFEDELAFQIKAAHLPEPKRQYKFHEDRQWKADFAWTEHQYRIILEVDGGVFSGGRHTRGAEYTKDRKRDNEATLRGWTVYRVTTGMVTDGTALQLLEEIFK